MEFIGNSKSMCINSKIMDALTILRISRIIFFAITFINRLGNIPTLLM